MSATRRYGYLLTTPGDLLDAKSWNGTRARPRQDAPGLVFSHNRPGRRPGRFLSDQPNLIPLNKMARVLRAAIGTRRAPLTSGGTGQLAKFTPTAPRPCGRAGGPAKSKP